MKMNLPHIGTCDAFIREQSCAAYFTLRKQRKN